MSAYTTTYQRVPTRRSHRGRCPGCGKTVTRTRTFERTVNPFNRNDDGSVRTPEQVREQVEAAADAWTPDFTHCTPEGDAQ